MSDDGQPDAWEGLAHNPSTGEFINWTAPALEPIEEARRAVDRLLEQFPAKHPAEEGVYDRHMHDRVKAIERELWQLEKELGR